MDTCNKELNLNEMEQVNGGGKKLASIGQPVKRILESIACGGHDWVPTGKVSTKTYLNIPLDFDFLKYQREQYCCTKCGRIKWENC